MTTPGKSAPVIVAMTVLFLVAGLFLSSPIAREVIIGDIVDFFRPSSFFISLDADHDNTISRHEWQAYYYETNIYYDMAYRHETIDCNQNGNISWREYYTGIIKSRTCSLEKQGLLPFLPDKRGYVTERFPIIFTEDELSELNANVGGSIQEALRVNLSRHSYNKGETVLTETETANVSLSCQQQEDYELPAFISTLPAGTTVQSIRCHARNDNHQRNITTLVLNVEYRDDHSTNAALLTKALLIPPGGVGTFLVLMPEDIHYSKLFVALSAGS